MEKKYNNFAFNSEVGVLEEPDLNSGLGLEELVDQELKRKLNKN